MTDKLILLIECINRIIKDEYPDIDWYMQLHHKDEVLHGGNICPVCAITLGIEWIEKENIQHTDNNNNNNNNNNKETIQ